jgi:hypothetical protein
MNALRLAFVLWARDGIISLVAVAGWPRWRWASRAIGRLEAQTESLRGQAGARV